MTKKHKSAFEQRLNVLLYPCEDLPGQWGAHCLELDLVSQGNDCEDALEMIAEAIETIAAENLADGRPPFQFRSAPDDVWFRFINADEGAILRVLRIDTPPVHDTVVVAPRRAG